MSVVESAGDGDGGSGNPDGFGGRPSINDPDDVPVDMADDDDDDDDDETSSSSAFYSDSSLEYIMELAVTHASIKQKAKR